MRALLNRAMVVSASAFFTLLLIPTVLFASANATVVLHDGRVTIVARNASAAEILDEWTRAGGTTVVNADRLGSARLTIELVDVPEREALDVVLRSAAGYLAVERPVVPATLSRYERIFIMAASTPPRTPGGPAQPQQAPRTFEPPLFFPGGAQRVVGLDGQPVPDDQEGAPPPGRVPAPSGFSNGDAPSSPPGSAAPRATTRPIGVPVPGMIVAPPQTPSPQVPIPQTSTQPRR